MKSYIDDPEFIQKRIKELEKERDEAIKNTGVDITPQPEQPTGSYDYSCGGTDISPYSLGVVPTPTFKQVQDMYDKLSEKSVGLYSQMYCELCGIVYDYAMNTICPSCGCQDHSRRN